MNKELTKSGNECPSEELLLSYVDDSLPDWEAAPLLEHIATCDDCAERTRELTRFRQMWSVLREGHESIFPGFEAAADEAASLASVVRELGGRVWSAARVVFEMSGNIPRLISLEPFSESPFGAFALAVPTRGDDRILARSTETTGTQKIEIAYNDVEKRTVVLLKDWEGDRNPNFAVQVISPDAPTQSGKLVALEWEPVATEEGTFRAVLPFEITPPMELLIAVGPRDQK